MGEREGTEGPLTFKFVKAALVFLKIAMKP